MAYILDANTFITAKNSYYAYDIVPSFWNSLLQEFRKDNIKSIDAVESEIMQGNDNLSAWFGNNVSGCRSANGESFILPSRKTQDVVNCYQTIATMVMTNRQYKDEQKSTFLSVADPWLVATAKTLKSRSIGLRPPVAEFFGVPFRGAVNNSYHGCMTVARYCDPIL